MPRKFNNSTHAPQDFREYSDFDPAIEFPGTCCAFEVLTGSGTIVWTMADEDATERTMTEVPALAFRPHQAVGIASVSGVTKIRIYFETFYP